VNLVRKIKFDPGDQEGNLEIAMNEKSKNRLRRRDFIASTAGSAAILVGLQARARAEGNAPPPPAQVPLGKTGIHLSRVGQGTGMHGGRRQSNHTRMGFEKLVALFRHAHERGVTFFDMADLYGTHVYFREALRWIPRDKITILTKLWWRFDGDPKTTPPAFQKKSTQMALERFLQEIATDHLDIVLLHCLQDPNWTSSMGAYMETLSEAKKKGQVRAVGVSCHNLGALKTAAATPWVDVILARINPAGARMDGSVDEVVPVLRKARENGKAIIGMKIYGEGSLANRADECIRYAQQNGLLDTMTVGAESPEQMDETLTLLGKYPAKKLV